ncbi:hypothetical protein AB1Y20_003496 [Prymnesium parvum]|uniref:Class I SAM-dependent methyltransferase n=1 Tax=Prymnesium parvum TaxID=97485 RepID=A0AB34JDR6_PRYPA
MWACADAIPGKLTSTGAWCLTHRVAGARGVVSFPDTGVSYPIPAHHQPASQRIVHALSKLLRKPINGTSRSTYLSLNDFGAGVGQYGAALKAIDASFRWRGYDGAGNVENWTKGMVNWFDLTIPLSLPRADWVLALEVAEHVPRRQEGIMMRNLHAHNCMGIIISWAVPGQVGHGHVNLRTSGYVIQRFESLGYAYDPELTKSMRHGSAADGSSRLHSHPWFLRSLLAFRRIQRVRSHGCFWPDWRN